MSSDPHKAKILYIAPDRSTFVRHDISILSEHYNVLTNFYNWRIKYLTPIYMLHQMLYLLIQCWSLKAIVVSFGGYWSFFPSLIGKLSGTPVYIILNGTDCVALPQINYGDLRSPLQRAVIKKSYQWAKMLLPVSASLVRTQNSYYGDDPLKLGYAEVFPKIKTPYKVVANGLKFDDWHKTGPEEPENNSFITVLSYGQEIRKGVPLILDLARSATDLNFILVGIDGSGVHDIPANVRCTGRLSVDELRSWYNRSRFYFQLSIFEGFGVALCEAMLCECVPIGSNVNAIPEIIGDTGYILNKRDPVQLEELVRKAMLHEDLNALGRKARQRILDHYSLAKRQKELVALTETV